MSIATMICKAGQSLAVERPQTTPDATGAPAVSGHVPIATGVFCWRQPVSSHLAELYSRRGLTISHRIYVAAELDVQAGDLLILTLADGTEVRHKSLGAPVDAAGLCRLWRLDAEQRSGEEEA